MVKEVKDKDFSAIAGIHTNANLRFISLSLTLFTFIIALQGDLLKNDLFLGIQLILPILLFIYSNLSKTRFITSKSINLERFSFYTFKLGFVLLMNAIGLLIFYLASQTLSIIFFSSFLILLVSYTFIISYERYKLGKKIKIKSDILTLVILLIGFSRVLGFY